MIRNYFKVAIRNLLKNPLSSFINVLGLSAGVACCVIAYTYMSLQFGMEDQHSNADRIFMVTNLVDRDGEPEWYGPTPAPLGLQLKEDFPQISHLARVQDRDVVVRKGETRFHEWTRMVDPDYLDMFDFEFVDGNPSALDDRNNVLISVEMAEKYFGRDNPMGQTLDLRFSGDQKVPLKVAGVVRSDETKTSFHFHFLTNINLLERVDPEFAPSDWSSNIGANLIMLERAEDVSLLQGQSESYAAIASAAQPDWKVLDYNYEPISTLFDRSVDIRWDISQQADVEGQWVLSIIALLMLLLACLNYLNIAITSAVRRLKEIGIRKVIGANRARLVYQFMIENILLSSIAMLMGLFIGVFLFLPGLNNLFAIQMGIEALSLEFFVFVIGLLLFTAFMSGAYPALYISRFQVISIFQGKTNFGRRNILSKLFLTLEFIIACIAVSCGVLFTLNTNYQQKKEWGYDQKSLVMMRFNDEQSLQQMQNELSDFPEVQSYAAGRNHLGSSLRSAIIEFPDRKIEARLMDVDHRYVKTVGLVLDAGDLLQEYDQNSVLVNETFVSQMDWENPIGESFRYDSAQYTVKGVLQDFHYYSFWNEVQPSFVRLAQEEDLRYLVVRTGEAQTIDLYEKLEAQWAELFPDEPFDGDYQTQLFADYFRNVNGHKVLMIWVSILALLMTCLGLYGLVGLNISGRKREFSIRKVLGAGNLALSKAVSSHFSVFLLVALVIGTPVSYLIVKSLFEMIYAYYMPVTIVPIVGSVALIVLTIFLTILSHLMKILGENPTEGLRVE